MGELSSKIAQVPAGLRIVVLDACRTTEALRAKGMVVEPGFTVQVQPPPAATGSVWVYASADGQVAQESDEIGGALFTHFWTSGLRGTADANGDRRVTLDESFNYAHSQTLLRSARVGGVLQRPQARLDVTAAGPLVLTELAGDRARVEFPRDNGSLYLVYAVGARSVVAEVYGSPTHPVRLALPPGRYIVQKRAGVNGAAAEVSLAQGMTRVLEPSDFRTFPSEKLAQKGALVAAPWSVMLRDTVYVGQLVDVADEVSIGIERREETWSLTLGPLASYALYDSPFNRVRERSLGAELSLDYAFLLGAPRRLRLGIDGRSQMIWQTSDRNDADRLAPLGYHTRDSFTAMAWGGGAHAALRFTIGTSGFVEATVRGLALGANTDEGVRGRASW